ncbi:MAG: hypothetical protein L3J26_00425 [Candidatus Polarisedimenticolaceae bacterium]|nr:hypothetical protein [Candidatus Polarisedimenticolaceae bacterium]
MEYNISEQDRQKAKIPHEIFLTNLIGNHILGFVSALGLAGSYWQPLALVPLISLAVVAYTMWRAKRASTEESWFVMCHWQLCVKRSRVLLAVMLLLVIVAILGWVAYTHLGMMDVAVKAMIGGVGVLPVMVTILVLIMMEIDAMHQATQGKISASMVELYPKPDSVTVSAKAS